MVKKTFKADSALQTLQLVQAELGASAIVVSMREIPAGPSWNPWKKSSVEIVAALPESETPELSSQIALSPAAVLRPAENKAGFEFIEERPEIEWDTEPEKRLAELRAQPPPRSEVEFKPGRPDTASGFVGGSPSRKCHKDRCGGQVPSSVSTKGPAAAD